MDGYDEISGIWNLNCHCWSKSEIRAQVWEEITWRPANLREGDTVGILVANGDMVLYMNGERVEVTGAGSDLPNLFSLNCKALAGG